MKSAYYAGNQQFELKQAHPEPVGPGMVRIKVAFCGICGTDVHIYHGKMDHRVQMPQVIGHEVSGEIDEIGEGVSGWHTGDRVVVRPLQPGADDPSDNGQRHIGKNLKFIGIDTPGGMQPYWNVPAYTLHKLPENMPLQLGALIEPLAVACHDVRLSRLQPGEHAVIIGGGPIGILIALVARHAGANVLLSEPNPHRLALCESLGISTVDPASADLAQEVDTFTKGAMADVVFEVSGVMAGVEAMTRLARARGRLIMVAIHSAPRPVDLFRFFWRELQLIGTRVYEPEDFDTAIALAASDSLPLAGLITQIAPLESVQELFEKIDRNPAGMKYMLQCTDG